MSIEQDRRDILKLHRDWWLSNHGTNIPLMKTCFPAGMNYLMFNLSSHPYFGIEEKIKLWSHYGGHIQIPHDPVAKIMRIEIRGDMAWLACEGLFPVRKTGPEGTGTAAVALEDTEEPTWLRIRATEVYQRDDGEGRPVWKIWHLHASMLCPEDEPRPGFGDTARERGLGGNPWMEPLSVLQDRSL